MSIFARWSTHLRRWGVRLPLQRPGSMTRVATHVEVLESRLVPYAASTNAWPNPQLITISFVPDGTIVGSNGSGNITSNLFSTFNAKFGSAAAWQNVILKAAQVWAQQTNINFTVVSDDGAAIGSGNYAQGDPGMGDIRIGGYNFGCNTLAQTFMPPPVNNYSVAGDIQLNTGQTFNIGSTYDLFTVATHEIGHALGLYHSGVVTADMYGTYQGTKTGLSSDDIAGIQSIYSAGAGRSPDAYDAAASNNTAATATDISSTISSTTYTAQLNNLDITTTSDVDYYKVTLPTGSSGGLSVKVQSAGLSLLAPKLTVYASDQTTVLGTASAPGCTGGTVTVNVPSALAGQTVYLKVQGCDTTAFGTGVYSLALDCGPNLLPAIAPLTTQVLNGNPISAGGGQAIKFNPEFQANSFTNNYQQTNFETPQAVAMDANGNSVVVWSSQGEDGSGWGVYGQLYHADGTPNGSEFRVNTTTSSDQEYASVAMDPNGDFVVTWSSNYQDGSGWGVYAQRYNSSGVAQGGEFRVNTTTANDQKYSTVAMDGNGNFVITWSSNGQDGPGWGIYAQRYNSSGVAQGGEFRVNTTTAGDQEYSRIAMDPNGDFVVTWSSNGQDGPGWGVYAQRYNSSGVAQGGEFRVNTTTANDQKYSTVAMDGNGNFVITWSSNMQDGSGWGVYAQRYNSSGVAQGGEFRVNTTTANDQEYSTVGMDGNGNFVITWSSNYQDGSGWGVYAQQYDTIGKPVGTEFQVNTTTSGNQQFSSLALDSLGDVMIVWSGQGANDTSGVIGQRFQIAGGNGLSPMEVSDTYDLTDSPDAPDLPATPLPVQDQPGPALAAESSSGHPSHRPHEHGAPSHHHHHQPAGGDEGRHQEHHHHHQPAGATGKTAHGTGFTNPADWPQEWQQALNKLEEVALTWRGATPGLFFMELGG